VELGAYGRFDNSEIIGESIAPLLHCLLWEEGVKEVENGGFKIFEGFIEGVVCCVFVHDFP
jgi:hypothetical protein